MKNSYLAIDDEKLVLSSLMRTIDEADPGAMIQGFTDAKEGLDTLLKGYRPSAAFLDIEMPGMSGLGLAKRIKEISPQTNIIFVTGFSNYSLEAYALHASGYVMKPATKEKIRDELENLRHPIAPAPSNSIRVQTFGNFQVYDGDQPIRFERSKSKELFAYLVDKHGAGCTIKELAAVLFEDRPYDTSVKNQMQNYISAMIKGLASVGAEDVIKKKHNNIAVDPTLIDCDYYRFLNWEVTAVNQYTGEYMSQYSWAEFRAAYIDQKWQDSEK